MEVPRKQTYSILELKPMVLATPHVKKLLRTHHILHMNT